MITYLFEWTEIIFNLFFIFEILARLGGFRNQSGFFFWVFAFCKYKPIKATKRTKWTKNAFAKDNDECEERNYGQIQMSEKEADKIEEMPELEVLSGHSSMSEDYD